jgi:hypothetical protein
MKKMPNHLLATLYLTTDKEQIGFLKFLLEGYDGLCILTTINANLGKIKVITTESRHDELQAVIRCIADKINITYDNLER